MKLTEKLERLETCLKLDDCLPIVPFPHGLNDIIGPSIFVGHIRHRTVFYPKELTLAILEKLFDKATKDHNRKAVFALIQFVTHNKKTFWRRYKKTELGARIMAEVLGRHD